MCLFSLFPHSDWELPMGKTVNPSWTASHRGATLCLWHTAFRVLLGIARRVVVSQVTSGTVLSHGSSSAMHILPLVFAPKKSTLTQVDMLLHVTARTRLWKLKGNQILKKNQIMTLRFSMIHDFSKSPASGHIRAIHIHSHLRVKTLVLYVQ